MTVDRRLLILNIRLTRSLSWVNRFHEIAAVAPVLRRVDGRQLVFDGRCRDRRRDQDPTGIIGDDNPDAHPALGRLDSALPARKISPSRMAATMALCYKSSPG